MIAGILAPLTPKQIRVVTGYGTPACWDGLATRLQSMLTATMPTNSETSTCHDEMPSAKRLPANTYPPTLCTSDIQNAKMLYQVQLCSFSGARSSFVNCWS